MRNIFLALLIGIMSFSFLMADAQAKRFGGGKSFGMKRDVNTFSRSNGNNSTAFNTASRTQPLNKPASMASKWLGPLAGLAIGGMLASLFMGHGLGTGILSWLMVGGLVFIAWTFIRNRMQPRVQNAQFQAQPTQNFTSNPFQAQSGQNYTDTQFNSTAHNDNVVPHNVIPLREQSNQSMSGFDETEFVRTAKSSFIRLQTAFDNKNLNDIREFTSPEVFAEIQLQIQERGDDNNVTDVVSIDADVQDFSLESKTMLATVLFSGQIREEQNAAPIAIKELWHFQKDEFKPNWVVAGIQQF